MKKYIVALMFICFIFLLFGCSDQGITVSFETNGGNQIDTIFLSEWNISQFPVPTRDGYVFDGWYVDEDLTNQIGLTMSQNKITLYAKWTEVTLPTTYTVTFETNGGSPINPLLINEGLTIIEPASPVKNGFTFNGWFLDASFTQTFSFANIITQDITLYAKWEQVIIPMYTITFDAMGGTPVNPITNIENATLDPLPLTEKTGYQFIGWFLDELYSSPANLTHMPNEDIIIFARWEINTYQIVFHSNGGSAVETIDLTYGQSIELNQQPTYLGYEFVGWYIDMELTESFSETTMPAENLNLYAKWNVIQVSIDFASQGGSPITSLTGVPGTMVSSPLDPEWEDYVFSGWYLYDESIEPYVFDVFPNESITLYADWGSAGLEFVLDDETQTYGVGIGSATEVSTIRIPKYHQDKPVTAILDTGFLDASYINVLILPRTITYIGERAFMDASSLTIFEIPSSVEVIGSSAFRNCHSIEAYQVSSENLHFESIDGVLFSKDLTTLIKYPQAKEGTAYTIANHVLTIGEDAFSGARNLLNIHIGLGVQTIKSHAFYQVSYLTEIIIPDQVTTIELYAFRECVSLESVTLGSGLTSISSYMFNYCISLEEIIIPSNITNIGYGAFYDCTHLARIYVLDDNASSVIQGALFMFTNTAVNLQIYFVNQGIADIYKTSNYWVSYASKITVGSPS